MDLAKASSGELVGLLSHPNVWQRRMAQRLLNERRDPSIRPALKLVLGKARSRDLNPRIAPSRFPHHVSLPSMTIRCGTRSPRDSMPAST